MAIRPLSGRQVCHLSFGSWQLAVVIAEKSNGAFDSDLPLAITNDKWKCFLPERVGRSTGIGEWNRH